MTKHPLQIDGDLVLSLASYVSQVLNSPEEDFLYYMDITEGDRLQRCAKASRNTILHEYIEEVCIFDITYTLDKHFDKEGIFYMQQWMDSLAIDYSDIVHPLMHMEFSDDRSEFCDDEDEDVIEKYADSLQNIFNEKAMPLISDAVFTLLYSDKDFLFKFNEKISKQIKKLKKDDYPDFLEGDGHLKRENPPQWLKDGVFYRDHGRCQECGTDLTQIYKNDTAKNYDHIIPLRQGGSNDPTNYQLMCEHCNKSKRDRSSKYRNVVWPFWDKE